MGGPIALTWTNPPGNVFGVLFGFANFHGAENPEIQAAAGAYGAAAGAGDEDAQAAALTDLNRRSSSRAGCIPLFEQLSPWAYNDVGARRAHLPRDGLVPDPLDAHAGVLTGSGAAARVVTTSGRRTGHQGVMMLIFVLKRIAFAILTLVVATLLAFVLVHLSGSTPGGVALGMSGTPEQVEAYNIEVGWYDPWIVQYLNWVGQVLQGNLGVSLIDGRPIGPDIAKRLPVTAALAVLGTLVSAVIGITMGVVAAVRGGAVDRGITALSGILLSLPAFWVGVLLVYVFAVQMRLLPATGLRPVRREPRGVGAIARAPGAHDRASPRPPASPGRRARRWARRSPRSTCAPSAPSARPTWRIVYVHALRGASLPILASVAIQFIVLFGGSVIIEVLFALPGIGQAMQAAVGSADLPFVQALVLVATLVVVVVNLPLELLNRILDPKLRAS